MFILHDFPAYCRNNLCTLQSFAASCQQRLPAAIGPVTTAVGLMKQLKGTERVKMIIRHAVESRFESALASDTPCFFLSLIDPMMEPGA